jgi:ribosomal protein S18 acetylase RimI-like enzyme
VIVAAHLSVQCTLHAIDATVMHRIITLIACTSALTETRVRTRVINDGEILRRSAEVGPLVRAFSVGQRGRGSGVSTLNVAEASALKAATYELIAKRKKCDGRVIVAQRSAAPRDLVGFALVNDDVLETVSVAVDERGRGVGAQLVDAAGALASGAGNGELLVEVEPQNGRGRNFFEGLGFEITGERRGTLAVLSKSLPWRPPPLVVSFVVALPVLVALGGIAASGDVLDFEGALATASTLVAQLDVEGALTALADRLPSI